MSRYVIRRTLIALLLILVVSTVSQLIIHILPGDPAYLILGAEMAPDPKVLEAVRHDLGLDQPLYKQLGKGLYGVFTLSFGTSLREERPVSVILRDTLPRSAQLVVVSLMFAILIGVTFGILAALWRNSLLDWVITTLSALGISTPVFVTGSLLIYLFALRLAWVPASGYIDFSDDPIGFLLRLSLPVLTLGFAIGAEIARMTRSTMLEVLRQAYLNTARAKGLKENVVILKHALRNALIPIAAMIGIQFGSMFGRTVLIETVFNWPGMSTALVRATHFHDFPVVQGIVTVIAAIFVFVNLATDIVYAIIDPRISYN